MGEGVFAGREEDVSKALLLGANGMEGGAQPEGLRQGRKRPDGGAVDEGSEEDLGLVVGSPEGLQTGQMAGMGVPGPWAEALAGEPSSSCWDDEAGSLTGKARSWGLELAMSSSITTRVGWGAWSTFCEGPSSGPGVVLDRRLRVEEGRRTRLKEIGRAHV